MFKKFSSGILILILIGLLAVYFIVRFAGQKERTFRDKVLSFDPAVVTAIQMNDPAQGQSVELRLSGNTWQVISEGRSYTADSNMVQGILSQLSDLPTKRYAGKGRDSWEKYELTEDQATLVTLFSGPKQIASVYIGKFSYTMPQEQPQAMQMRQQQGDMTSFVRLADEQDVYAVEGFLKMSLNRNANSYRDRKLVSVNPDDITRFVFDEDGRETTLENKEGRWFFDGFPADSAETARYKSTMARLSGGKFTEDGMPPGNPSHTLTLEGNNFAPIQIRAYPVADTNVNYVITSSVNQGSNFNGKEGSLFEKIFRPFPTDD